MCVKGVENSLKKKKTRRTAKYKTVDDHFSIRCLQRLGYIPNRKELVKLIQEAKLPFLDRQSNRVTRWLWTDPIKKIDCILPYDKERKQIITVLFKREEDILDGNKAHREE